MTLANAPEWTKGYRTDLEYTFGLYPFLNPDLLLLGAVLQGVKPPASILSYGPKDERQLVYCELGCGQGLTLNQLAARDPGGKYYGIDYNPNQISNARHFAKAANLTNVTFLEESFADLERVDIPDCDVIVLHGIWSWVSGDMQNHIVSFIRRKLKPGGLCYISYNCAVGRNDDPMRQLLLTMERTSNDKGEARLKESVDAAKALAAAGARYFTQHPVAKTRLDALSDMNPNYIVHEYLNANWKPSYFSEVADAMAEAKLAYVGAVDVAWNRIDLVLPKEAKPFAARMSSVNDLEFLKDLWIGSQFRKDLFSKGRKALTVTEQEALLLPLRFVLLRTRANCALSLTIPVGTGALTPALFEPVFDRLAKGPATGADLAVIAKAQGTTLVNVIQLLLVSGYVALCVDEAAIPRISKSLAGFDEAIAQGVDNGEANYLVSQPGTGAALTLNSLDYFIARATREKVKNRAASCLAHLKKHNQSISQNGVVAADDTKALALIEEKAKLFDQSLSLLISAGLGGH
jgi:SAM-dependent methyltransferase